MISELLGDRNNLFLIFIKDIYKINFWIGEFLFKVVINFIFNFIIIKLMNVKIFDLILLDRCLLKGVIIIIIIG